MGEGLAGKHGTVVHAEPCASLGAYVASPVNPFTNKITPNTSGPNLLHQKFLEVLDWRGTSAFNIVKEAVSQDHLCLCARPKCSQQNCLNHVKCVPALGVAMQQDKVGMRTF